MEIPAICTPPFPLTEPTEITGFFNFLGVLRELSERFNGRDKNQASDGDFSNPVLPQDQIFWSMVKRNQYQFSIMAFTAFFLLLSSKEFDILLNKE